MEDDMGDVAVESGVSLNIETQDEHGDWSSSSKTDPRAALVESVQAFFRSLAHSLSDLCASARRRFGIGDDFEFTSLCSRASFRGTSVESGENAEKRKRRMRFPRLLFRRQRSNTQQKTEGSGKSSLTADEARLVQLSWRLLTVASPGKQLPAYSIFKRIFALAPELRAVFAAPDEPLKKLGAAPVSSSDERFHHHARLFTDLIDFVVLNVTKLDSVVAPRLEALGRKHLAMAEMGFDPAYFPLFESAILDYIQVSLKNVNRVHQLSTSLQSLNSLESAKTPQRTPQVSFDQSGGLENDVSDDDSSVTEHRSRLGSTTSVATLSSSECCVAVASTVEAWEFLVSYIIRHLKDCALKPPPQPTPTETAQGDPEE